jgi:hypothetical protein
MNANTMKEIKMQVYTQKIHDKKCSIKNFNLKKKKHNAKQF